MLNKKNIIANYASTVILTICALISLIPLLWLIILSLKPQTTVMSLPPDISLNHLTLDNFRKLFKSVFIFRWFFNSIFITVLTTFTNVIFSSMAGYSFAKKQFKGKTILFMMTIGIMMINTQVILLPLFIEAKNLGLQNNYLGIMLPVMATPLYVFLSRQYMHNLSDELIASAKIDGCNEWTIFSKIILPISVPVLAVIAIFSFITQWNDFLWPMIITKTKEMRTLPVGLASIKQENEKTNYGILFSGAVFSMIPVLILFISCNKYFIKGLTVGAVKA